MTDDFGQLLRELRLAKGLSMGQLAKLVHFSKGYLSKIENGHRPPTVTLAKQCEAALDGGGALVALATPRQRPVPSGRRMDDDEVWVLALDRPGRIEFLPVGRRELLATGAGAVLGIVLARGAQPSSTDERVVPGLRAAFDEVRRLGMVTTPLVVLPSIIAQVHALRTLGVDSREPVPNELRVLASRVAEYAGWMCQEAGREAMAQWWTDYAVILAGAGNDSGLASYALVRRAEIAMYRQDPITTIELARRAQNDCGVGARILGLAARCEAQGHALAGDARSYRQALDRAATLLHGAEPDDRDRLVLGSSVAVDQVRLAAGWSLCDLGQPAQAAAVLDQEVPKIPGSSRRARARFGARQVLAYARNGEVEHACELLPAVLDDAVHVDSATIRTDLRDVARTLSRWHSHPAVRESYPQLTAALRQAH